MRYAVSFGMPNAAHDLAEAPSPLDLFARVAGEPGVAFLDGGGGRSHLAWRPRARLEIDRAGRIDGAGSRAGDPIAAIARFLDAETSAGRTVIGALSYDLRPWIEPRAGAASRARWPLAVLHAYDRVRTFDEAATTSQADLERVRLGAPRPSLDRAAYRRRFARVHEALRDGEIYQANLAIAFDAMLDGSAAALYRRLSASHPVPFGAYLDLGDVQLLSNSPELFLERRGDRIATRPIKGTRRRGRDAAEDRRLREELANDAKERAEHLMIVDLERNDLGRIAAIGSVRVDEFARVVTFGTLHHLESTVSARLRPDVRTEDVLRATFPGGSITGAPKIRAMQLIDEIEPEARSFYTGAILHAEPGGALTASVNIRAAIVDGERVRYFAGGGVVIDSTADAEYEECWLKAKAFFAAAS
jgi:aminodeoxychorismate synthase component I